MSSDLSLRRLMWTSLIFSSNSALASARSVFDSALLAITSIVTSILSAFIAVVNSALSAFIAMMNSALLAFIAVVNSALHPAIAAVSLASNAARSLLVANWLSTSSHNALAKAFACASVNPPFSKRSAKATALKLLDRKSTRPNSSHTVIYTLSLHDALPILAVNQLPQRAGQGLRLCIRESPVFQALGKGNGIKIIRSEEHTSELQSHSDLHSFPTRRSSDLGCQPAPTTRWPRPSLVHP